MKKIGIIGMSEGNGHPFSWSALINGYNPSLMEDCGFPTIPRYLEANHALDNLLPGARITHVWTQDEALSQQIAQSCHIQHVAVRPEDFIGAVDAVILARDDAENHPRFAEPFLQAGLPVLIDKPLALNRAGGEELLNHRRYPGQIFTCTGLRFGREFEGLEDGIRNLGELVWARAVCPKSWEKYAIHLIEPIVMVLRRAGYNVAPAGGGAAVYGAHGATSLQISLACGIILQIATLGKGDPQGMHFEFSGTKGTLKFSFLDSYYAFRSMLAAFLASLQTPAESAIDPEETLLCLEILQQGIQQAAS